MTTTPVSYASSSAARLSSRRAARWATAARPQSYCGDGFVPRTTTDAARMVLPFPEARSAVTWLPTSAQSVSVAVEPFCTVTP